MHNATPEEQEGFYGRENFLRAFDNRLNAGGGGLWPINGGPGLGKSSLLKRFEARAKQAGRTCLRFEIPEQAPDGGLGLLQTLCLDLREEKKMAQLLEWISGGAAGDVGFSQSLGKVTDLADQQIDDPTVKKATAAIKLLGYFGEKSLQLRHGKRYAEAKKFPELALMKRLEALAAGGKLVVVVDTFERIYRWRGEIPTALDFSGAEPRAMDETTKNPQEWLHNLLQQLAKSGALVIAAGRQTHPLRASEFADAPDGGENLNALAPFTYDEMLRMARGISPLLNTEADKPGGEEQLGKALVNLSFEGNPLWLRVGINFLEQYAQEQGGLESLPTEHSLQECFGQEPLGPTYVHNVTHSACKLALLNRVLGHTAPDLNVAWRVALPQWLEPEALAIVLGEQKEAITDAFIGAGLFPPHARRHILHDEVRDLLIAFAKKKNLLNTEETRDLHRRLAQWLSSHDAAKSDQQTTLAILRHRTLGSEHLHALGLNGGTFWEALEHSIYMNVESKSKLIADLPNRSKEQIESLQESLAKERQLGEEVFGQTAFRMLRKRVESGKATDIVSAASTPNTWRDYTQENGNDPNGWGCLGISLSKQEPTEAEMAFEKACGFTSGLSTHCLNRYAVFLWKDLKKSDRAQEMFERTISADPNNAIALGNFALFLQNERKEMDRAQEMFERAIAAEPNDADILGNFANFLWQERKEMDRALEMYERAIDADPNHANTLGNFANFLWQERKEMDRALEMYERAIDADPNDANTLGNFALFLQNERKEMDRAQEMFERAIDADPNHANTLGNFAVFLKMSARRWTALRRCTNAPSTLIPITPTSSATSLSSSMMSARRWTAPWRCTNAPSPPTRITPTPSAPSRSSWQVSARRWTAPWRCSNAPSTPIPITPTPSATSLSS
ncbi:putative tetratricopeptide repeat protein,ATPase [Magnetofaba australis IT-1]|uniref:Putative tetratricopeptide repeat protein,ATPase n=1 Tax=Magnetofaba australis IT-1 TaxID=1434232 RepID=A0A1Y2K1E5_9PROT|nr:tetratricopeptide repeat protein [Magnetofaba australis]OSM01792.1 putative tetratricopeptide repeat protein,ATPase [Magnetofaba australis IT-1]